MESCGPEGEGLSAEYEIRAERGISRMFLKIGVFRDMCRLCERLGVEMPCGVDLRIPRGDTCRANSVDELTLVAPRGVAVGSCFDACHTTSTM